MPVTEVSRVHNKETTEQIAPIPTYGEGLRHSCQSQWSAAEQVYATLDEGKSNSRDERLRHCRSIAWFYRHTDTGEVRVGSNACHLRWCPVCAQTRRNYIAHVVGEWIPKAVYPKFLTLTLRHTKAPLIWQVENLYKYFRELRRRKEFDKHVTGGIWFFQIKKSKSDGLWHPHLHCIITGLYLSKHKLHKMWCQVTHGSFVADIRGIDNPQKAANDAARYASSPGTLIDLDQPDACELVEAMHGRRICGTWGTGRAVSLRPQIQKDKEKWHNIGSWYVVLGRRYESTNARAILEAWMDKRPLPDGINCIITDEFSECLDRLLGNSVDLDEVFVNQKEPP